MCTQPRRALPCRRLLIAAVTVACLFGVAELAVAVYRIQTDKGELIITSASDDVEVVVKQGGRVVRVIDTKTDKSIKLRSGVYELELTGSSEGLKIDIEKATLTRGKTVLARIERWRSPLLLRRHGVARLQAIPPPLHPTKVTERAIRTGDMVRGRTAKGSRVHATDHLLTTDNEAR